MGGWRKLMEGFDEGGEGGRWSKMGEGDLVEGGAGWDTTIEEGGGREVEEGWVRTLEVGVGRENCSAACQKEGEEGVQVKKGLANLVIYDCKDDLMRWIGQGWWGYPCGDGTGKIAYVQLKG